MTMKMNKNPEDMMGEEVGMPEPLGGDSWNFSFVGTVIDIRHEVDGTPLLTVEDGENDCFDIEADRVEALV